MMDGSQIPEGMRRLPYVETPARAEQVVDEFATLAALIAGVVSRGGRMAGQMIEDATREPGQAIAVQKVRAALALESFVGGYGEEIIKIAGEAIVNAAAALEADAIPADPT